MSFSRSFPLGAIALACAACSQQDRECDYLKEGYVSLETNLAPLADYSLEKVPESVIGDIQQCWAAQPYGGPRHSILLQEARKVSRDRYYLMFEPLGITDIMLVFLVDKQGNVIKGYAYSTL